MPSSTFSDLYFDCSPQYSCALVPEIVLLNPYHETSKIATYFGENVFFHDSPYLCLPEVCFHYQEYNFPETAKTGFAPKIWICIFTIHLNWFLRTCL